MTKTQEQQNETNELFTKFREESLARNLSNTEAYDKAILTLTSGSLALSLFGMNFIIPLATASYIVLLVSAWGLFALSILCLLCSYRVSNRALEAQLDIARDYYKKCIEDAFDRKNIFIKINNHLNIITGLTFSIALCLLVTFIIVNIDKMI